MKVSVEKLHLDVESAITHFVDCFGGLDELRTYERTYKAYVATMDKIKKGEDMQSRRVNFVHIALLHASYTLDNENICVILTANLPVMMGSCLMCADATCNGKTMHIEREPNNEFMGNGEKVTLNIPLTFIGDSSIDDLIIEATVYDINDLIVPYTASFGIGIYFPEKRNPTANISQAQVMSQASSERVSNAAKEAVFAITHPREQTPTTKNQIRISHLTHGWGYPYDKNEDYYYSHSECSSEDGSGYDLCIPTVGSITVDAKHELTQITGWSLSVKNRHGTESDYAYIFTPTLVGQVISWKLNNGDLKDRWGINLRPFIDDYTENVIYTLSIATKLKKGRKTFLVTNDPGNTNAHFIENIPTIRVYRDCFLKGTDILMADDKPKKVEKIEKGDLVRALNGVFGKVASVTPRKQTEDVATIQTKDGKSIEVTAHHPFETAKGLLCACLVAVDSKVKTKEGESVVTVSCVAPREECETYSIELEGDEHRLYANGFLMGDSFAEKTKDEEITNLSFSVSEEWRADYIHWEETDHTVVQ